MLPSVEFSPLVYPLIHRFEMISTASETHLRQDSADSLYALMCTLETVQDWYDAHCRELSPTEQVCTLDLCNVLTAFYGLYFFLKHPEKDRDPEATKRQFREVTGDLQSFCKRAATDLRECTQLEHEELSLALP